MKAIVIKNPEQAERDKECARIMRGTDRNKAQLAFNELYTRHKSAIFFKVVMGFVKNNKETAEDLTQEIFEKAYRKIESYDFSSCFSTWLYTIAINHCRDYKRTERYEVLSLESLKSEFNGDEDSSEASFQIEDKSADVLTSVVKSERAKALADAIKNGIKSEDAKKIITLIFLEEKRYDVVSQEMNMPIGTVKAFMFRAKTELKEYLSKKEKDFKYAE